MMNRSRLVTNVTSKLSLRSNVNNNEMSVRNKRKCNVQVNFVHEFGFKIVKRQLVENVDLIHKV